MKYAKANDYVGIVKQRKIVEGRLYNRYFVNSEGKIIGIPIGVIIKQENGINYVYFCSNSDRMPANSFCQFSYADKVSQENALISLIKLINARSKAINTTCISTRTRIKECKLHSAFNIDVSKLPTGVSLCSLNKGTLRLVIVVSRFDESKNRFSSKTVYVGTINNWKERYEQKLEEAIKIRNESLKTYNELTKVTT